MGVKDYKTVVYAEDMTDEMTERAILTAKEAMNLNIQSGQVYQTIASYIRTFFDKEYGQGWNCIVGRSFGSYVTHEIKTYAYYSVCPGIYILLWRS